MATRLANSSGPMPDATAGGGALQISPQQIQQAFDNGIWYLLSLWPALHVACQNNWGGADSSDKKDWFAGAISDLLSTRPETDLDDLVVFMLEVMQDEFETFVEDDSEEEVAKAILALKKRLVEEGDLNAAREVEKRWRERGKMKVDVEVVEEDGEVADDDDDLQWQGSVDEDGDVDMDDFAPELVPAVKDQLRKPEPEVDDEGFTKVVSKKKR